VPTTSAEKIVFQVYSGTDLAEASQSPAAQHERAVANAGCRSAEWHVEKEEQQDGKRCATFRAPNGPVRFPHPSEHTAVRACPTAHAVSDGPWTDAAWFLDIRSFANWERGDMSGVGLLFASIFYDEQNGGVVTIWLHYEQKDWNPYIWMLYKPSVSRHVLASADCSFRFVLVQSHKISGESANQRTAKRQTHLCLKIEWETVLRFSFIKKTVLIRFSTLDCLDLHFPNLSIFFAHLPFLLLSGPYSIIPSYPSSKCQRIKS
jgi:hypothetical protein